MLNFSKQQESKSRVKYNKEESQQTDDKAPVDYFDIHQHESQKFIPQHHQHSSFV
jgi:hypothetical protein